MGAILAVIVIAFIRALIAGWGLMLAVGVAHHEWVPNLPTIGLAPAMLIAVLIGMAFSVPGPDSK